MTAKGIAITNDIAEIIQIQTNITKGDGKVIIKGKFTSSIIESIRNSLCYIKKNIEISELDINILIEGNKYPITGSSLGLAIYSSIISALTNIPIENNLVFTGEITEDGEIKKVGGMKLKKACAEKHSLKLCTTYIE